MHWFTLIKIYIDKKNLFQINAVDKKYLLSSNSAY